jgi:hypothetical protein
LLGGFQRWLINPFSGLILRIVNRAKAQIKYSREIARPRLFNEKAELLRRGRFVSQVFRPDFGFTMTFGGKQPTQVERRGADEEATLAFVTTFRFFIHKNDEIELGQVADLYDGLPVSDEEKQRTRVATDSVKAFLDSPCEFGINGKTLSRRRLLYVFIYGGLAHANTDKRDEYEKWVKSDAAPIMQCMFEEIVATILRVIVSFLTINTRTIQLLESLQAAGQPSLQ